MDERAGALAGSRRVLAARVVGPLPDRRHVLRGQRGPQGPGRRRDRRARATAARSTRCSTSSSTTTCRRSCGRCPSDSDLKSWQMRAEAWDHPLVMIGGSDAGAHLDRMCGAPYTTSFLGDTFRGPAARVARTVRAADDADARAALRAARPRRGARGLPRRSRRASIPRPSRPARSSWSTTCPAAPAGSTPTRSACTAVFVNGTTIVADGKPTGARPGTVMRSGRDTYTVPIPADA